MDQVVKVKNAGKEYYSVTCFFQSKKKKKKKKSKEAKK